jgi:hypothetical protein
MSTGNHRRSTQTNEQVNESTADRLALSRAQHRQSRVNRPKSVSDDDDEIDGASDWSDSDRECCPLSDIESMPNMHGSMHEHVYATPFDTDPTNSRLQEELSHVDRTSSSMNNSSKSSAAIDDHDYRVTHVDQLERSRPLFIKNTRMRGAQIQNSSQMPLLPARRNQSKHLLTQSRSSSRSQAYSHQTSSSSLSRLHLCRGATSVNAGLTTTFTKDSRVSSHNSIDSHDKSFGDEQQRDLSPNSFQPSFASRVYEAKKVFVDDADYGRLTDTNNVRTLAPGSRQKWGTIIHPPFPLGYQHMTPEQVTQSVKRLASPIRRSDQHTTAQNPSKRCLSIDETEALVRHDDMCEASNVRC